jgi:hypothetical protein
MHLTPASDVHSYNIDEYENESFQPIIEESRSLTRKVNTLFKVSNDLEKDISEIANKGGYDLLLIGVGKSIYEGTLLGKVLGFSTRILHPEKLFDKISDSKAFKDSALDDRTTAILTKTRVAMGIFIDKGFTTAERILIILSSQNDEFLLDYAQRFIANNQSQIIIIQVGNVIGSNTEVKERIRLIEQSAPNHLAQLITNELSVAQFQGIDLLITSYETWTALIHNRAKALVDAPSTLIVRDSQV